MIGKSDANRTDAIMYIRHASSKYNLWYEYMTHLLSESEFIRYQDEIEEVKKLKGKRDFALRDSLLSSKGISQAESAALTYQKMPIKVVFVSPLRRTLETCRILFENHPNKPRVIVHPLIREILNLPNDVPIMLNETMKQYGSYDFTLFNEFVNPSWHFAYVLNESDRKSLLDALSKSSDSEHLDYMEIVEQYKQHKKATAPKHYHRIEGYENVRKRAVAFTTYLQNFMKTNGLKAEEVAVVTHGVFIGYSQAEKFNEFHKATFKIVPNCGYTYVDIKKITQ